jgi:hypothetical protein
MRFQMEADTRAHDQQPHYSPWSVGALMDPSFLLRAVIDADGGRQLPSAMTLALRAGRRVAQVFARTLRH